MFKLQKNVPNFKGIKMFVFAYFTMSLITIYRELNSKRDCNIFCQKIKLFIKSMGGTTN